MKVAIVTDSTNDWTKDQYEKNNVVMIPLKVNVNDEVYLDSIDLGYERFYDLMEDESVTLGTAAPSPGDFIEAFDKLADEGYDEIFAIHLAPTLSGTMASSQVAAEHAKIPVVVYNSLGCISMQGLLTEQACALRDQGLSAQGIADAMVKYSDAAIMNITPGRLENLIALGRVTEEQCKQAGILNTKLIFGFDSEGKLYLTDKVKGDKGVIKAMVKNLKTFIDQYGHAKVRATHSRNPEGVETLLAAFDEAGLDYELSSIDKCGGVVASHFGLKTLGFAAIPAHLDD